MQHITPQQQDLLKDPAAINPHSFRRIVGTLLEVNGCGFWETSDENITQLKDFYQEIKDRIEGVTEG
ncbi:MAG: hypothetical protein WD136_06550 [Cyanobium sp.]